MLCYKQIQCQLHRPIFMNLNITVPLWLRVPPSTQCAVCKIISTPIIFNLLNQRSKRKLLTAHLFFMTQKTCWFRMKIVPLAIIIRKLKFELPFIVKTATLTAMKLLIKEVNNNKCAHRKQSENVINASSSAP